MKVQDILNYHLANPPFEISDTMKYASMLQFVADTSLVELSENDAILDETTIITPASTTGSDVVLYDMMDIHPKFMELVVLQEADYIKNTILSLLIASDVAVDNALKTALDEGSVLSYMAVKDSIGIIEDYFATKLSKMIYRDKEIKLSPSTAYYVLFRRYRTVNEVPNSLILKFKQLFEINLYLYIYQSDIFAAEGGIRSVSLSGLSVSFNVPGAESKVNQLLNQKAKLLSALAMDYDDIGVF